MGIHWGSPGMRSQIGTCKWEAPGWSWVHVPVRTEVQGNSFFTQPRAVLTDPEVIHFLGSLELAQDRGELSTSQIHLHWFSR